MVISGKAAQIKALLVYETALLQPFLPETVVSDLVALRQAPKAAAGASTAMDVAEGNAAAASSDVDGVVASSSLQLTEANIAASFAGPRRS